MQRYNCLYIIDYTLINIERQLQIEHRSHIGTFVKIYEKDSDNKSAEW